MNRVLFCFWIGWALLGNTGNSEILLKYPKFEFFSCFHDKKKIIFLSFSTLHCTIKCDCQKISIIFIKIDMVQNFTQGHCKI